MFKKMNKDRHGSRSMTGSRWKWKLIPFENKSDPGLMLEKMIRRKKSWGVRRRKR
jgi:hypothetical protein